MSKEATQDLATPPRATHGPEEAWVVAWAKLEGEMEFPATLGALHVRRTGRARPSFFKGFTSSTDCLEPFEPTDSRAAE